MKTLKSFAKVLVILCTLVTASCQRTVEHELWTINCRISAEKLETFKNDKVFAMEQISMPPMKIINLFAACAIDLRPKFTGLEPNCDYVLYCPNVGWPEEPEMILPFRTNAKGENGVIYFITVAGIPGFCWDWYLFSEKTLRIASFVYQPIVARGNTGKELYIYKKETGGNVLEVFIKGFAPHEKVLFSSNSEGVLITKTLTMDEKGNLSFVWLPAVVNKTKGTVTLSIAADHETVQASCNWDTSSLKIRRFQEESKLKRRLKSIGEKQR